MDKEVHLIQAGRYWAKIQAAAQNAVVQVFAQVGPFNWLEPYKIEEQYENRGSGFFINNQGYFVTNAHVINQAKQVWVHVPVLGRQPLHAHVVSICPDRDFALLCLKEESLDSICNKLGEITYLPFGNSDFVQRVETVLSLGYPLGQHYLKSTTGVVSGRELLYGRTFIQITAPVNPGNSGGPLLNARGQVIGIAIATVPLANNIGYVIPINELKIVLDNMYTNVLVHKPMLGAQFMFASDEKIHYLKNPSPAGLYVTRVFRGSLLDKAGVCARDMLYEFNGHRIDAYGDADVDWSLDKVPFYDLVSRIKIGDQVPMVFYRQGKRVDIKIPFELIHIFSIRMLYPDYEPIQYETIGGIVIMELTANHIPLLIKLAPELVYYQLPENRLEPVLVIAYILPGSYAHQLRMLRIGDIITHINDKKVKRLRDYRRFIRLSLETGFVVIKTKMEILVVFSLEKLLTDEGRLFKAFGYPISKTVQRLYRILEKRRTQK